jgi:hypothetical protein
MSLHRAGDPDIRPLNEKPGSYCRASFSVDPVRNSEAQINRRRRNKATPDVRFWHLADINTDARYVRFRA